MQGMERCSCYPNSTCNGDLACISDICVDLKGTSESASDTTQSEGTGPSPTEDESEATTSGTKPSMLQCPACGSGFCDRAGLCARGVFISSRLFSGNLGGLTGADQHCRQLAEAAGLRGEWMAWLSDPQQSAGLRIPGANEPYVLVDGTRVAPAFDTFRTSIGDIALDPDAIYLEHAIDLDEFGNEPPRGSACPFDPTRLPVWSSTATDGGWDFEATCGEWLSEETLPQGEFDCNYCNTPVYLADARAVDSFWTAYFCGEYECSRTASLYCFQSGSS